MIDAQRIRDVTEEVLGRPAYDELEPSLGAELLGRARSAIAEIIDAILGTAAAGGIGTVIAYGLVALLLIGGVVLLVGLRRGGEVDRVLDVDTAADAASLLAEADRARGAGDLADAVRARYGALVLTLVEAGVLAGRPGLTVGEVDAAIVRGLPEATDPGAAAGRVLADVVYGDVEPERSHDDTVAEGLSAVARAAGRRDLAGRSAIGIPS